MEDDQKKQAATKQQGNNLARINRNLIERNRRNHMKDLFSKLFSLVPVNQNSKLSITELLDQATTYTKQLQEKVEKMRERKELLKVDCRNFEPIINIKYSLDFNNLEVTIISGSRKSFLLHQVISVLEEEGAEVVSTTYQNAGDKAFYTIYAKAFSSRIGIETSRVDERLKKLIS
ncbi:Transcription factor like [Melia azedarach]|uniref:Transcription factor like n=1 Tax=Melia azedarach TaxID=155640 RepID=A0ACC1XI51_MELAZ|nr:Transcription factor like [Melia azedarach]